MTVHGAIVYEMRLKCIRSKVYFTKNVIFFTFIRTDYQIKQTLCCRNKQVQWRQFWSGQ